MRGFISIAVLVALVGGLAVFMARTRPRPGWWMT